MKKVDRNSLYIPYILARLLLVGLIIYFLIQAFSSYAQWHCAGLSRARHEMLRHASPECGLAY